MAKFIQIPTADELEAAIKVLVKLGERLNAEAAHSIVQMPETQLGARYAGDIRSQTLEQTLRIGVVATQLKNWQEEMSVPESWCVSDAQKNVVENKTSVEEQWDEKEIGFQKSWNDARDSFQKAREWLGHKLPYKERKAA
jgi:hypothetical protein